MGADVLLTSARRQGDLQAEAWGYLDQIESLLALGDMARATPLLDAVLPFLDKDIGRSDQVWGHGLTAIGYLRRGRPADAWAHAVKANAVSRVQAPVAVYTFEGYAGAAEALLEMLERPDPSVPAAPALLAQTTAEAVRALASYARVFPIARPRAHLCRGILDAVGGRGKEAVATLRKGLAIAVKLGMPYEEAKLLCELAKRLPPGRPERAGLLDRAIERFERLGTAHDLRIARRPRDGLAGR